MLKVFFGTEISLRDTWILMKLKLYVIWGFKNKKRSYQLILWGKTKRHLVVLPDSASKVIFQSILPGRTHLSQEDSPTTFNRWVTALCYVPTLGLTMSPFEWKRKSCKTNEGKSGFIPRICCILFCSSNEYYFLKENETLKREICGFWQSAERMNMGTLS